MLTPGCADSADVWGYDVEQAREKLRNRSYEPFLELDFARIDAAEVQRLGDGSAYYLALIFSNAGHADQAQRLLRQSWSADPDPWRRRSLILLLDSYLNLEEWQEVIQLSEQALSVFPDDIEIACYGLEALYRSERYDELLSELDALQPLKTDGGAGRWSPAVDASLWRAVAAYRLQTADWPQRFYAAFADHQASVQHSRLFLFARNQGDILDRFDRQQSLLIEARYHLADGREAEAARLFRLLINERASDPRGAAELLGPELLPDLGRALISGGDFRLSAAALETLQQAVLGRATLQQRARLYEYLGRVQRSAGNRGAALESFEQALQSEASGAHRDRVAWYLLQTLMSGDPRRAVQFLEQQAESLHSPAYFSGALERLAAQLVALRDWASLQRAWRALDGWADQGTLAQYSVINAVAVRSGLAAGGQAHAESYLEQAYNQWQNPYYALVAAVLLDRTSGLLYGAETADTRRTAAAPQNAETPIEAYVAGYFDHGLTDQGYLAARRYAAELSNRALAGWAAIISESGNYIDSMRLMDLVVRRSNQIPLRDWAYVMYPRAFAAEMGAVIQAEVLEPEIFYALVREESYFSADISSHVGAVGLAQLMPATAAEVARAMRLENPILTDPATNLTLGARYLRGLIDRFDSLQDALLGYNAGPTRARRWRAQNGALPPILFQEAVPFYETRHYVRKIFVSAAFYGRLYGGIEPGEVYAMLF